MSRNSSGVCSPPGSYPPAAGSVISRADYMALVDDIYAILTDSMARSQAIKSVDGSALAPAYTFASDQASGLYKTSSDVRMAVAGALAAKFTSVGMDVTGALTAASAVVAGQAQAATVTATGNVVVGGTLQVSGATTLAGGLSGQVARGNLPTVGQQVSISTGSTTMTSSWMDAPGLFLSLTTTGRPVILNLQPDGSGLATVSVGMISGQTRGTVSLALVRDGTTIASWSAADVFDSTNTTGNKWFQGASGLLTFLDAPASGAHSYKIQCQGTGNLPGLSALKLVAFEL